MPRDLNPPHYLDGEPYYCEVCNLGYGEYLACEEPDCKLEDASTARMRRIRYLKGLEKKRRKRELRDGVE